MLKSQQELNFSQYTDLYDKLIPQNHLFRKINELIDFSFIRDELKDKYSPDNGRTAEDPEYLFKFLFLKCLHPMSDVDLVERALYDLKRLSKEQLKILHNSKALSISGKASFVSHYETVWRLTFIFSASSSWVRF